MQQLSFLEPPASSDAVPAWDLLDNTQRAEVIATLARVIAKAIPAATALHNNPENTDE